MIERTLTPKLRQLATKFPFVLLTGPRQSGKTTLVRQVFPDYQYVSLEELDNRQFAQEDPRGFIAQYPDKTIVDEVQRVPGLLSYLQTHADLAGKEGMYILTGSQNLLLLSSVDQSLAGRVGILTLLPFSHGEMESGGVLPPSVDEEIWRGGYPRLHERGLSALDYYPNYIETYVERDVRDIRNVGDLSRFVKFLGLCAGRIGQLLNLSSLANECGVSIPTIDAWLSVLQASYLVFLLRADHRNFSKRLVKSPKLYFHDTGVACSLLGIQTPAQVATHYLRGGLFENLVVSEFLKRGCHAGVRPSLSFWRDSNGNEVDLLLRDGEKAYPVEIKSGRTPSDDWFKSLAYWNALAGESPSDGRVVYAGNQPRKTSRGNLIPWNAL